jgi:hypothetical protein
MDAARGAQLAPAARFRNGSGEVSMTRSIRYSLATLAFAAVCLASASLTLAGQAFFQQRAVGGVSIDPDGVLNAVTTQDERDLEALRERTPLNVPAGLDEYTDLRAVSLKQIEATIARCRAENKPIPEEVDYLAGLLRVKYVFVYPDRQDIVIAGPAEGWKMDQLGNVVGRTTNRPVLKLDDLMLALRSGASSRLEPISCSIDPTQEGLQRLQQVLGQLREIGDPDETLATIEEALGPQQISVTGVPATSHFARVLVAADFRMKRIAMDFERAPVDGLPSYLTMVTGRGQSMTPRWWLAPNYEPLAKTADGLAWELRGPGVKCLTEDEFVSEAGQRTRTGQAGAAPKKWANMMTSKFSDLANHDSAFGQLRNAMDLAVIGALIEKEQLFKVAKLDAPWLMGQEELDRYPAPTHTASKASAVKKRGAWVISASGGVEIVPWLIADKAVTVEAVGRTRSELAADVEEFWWE